MEKLEKVFEEYVKGKVFNLDITIKEDNVCGNYVTSHDGYDNLGDFMHYLMGFLSIPYRHEGAPELTTIITSGNHQKRVDDLLRGFVERLYLTGMLPELDRTVLMVDEDSDVDELFDDSSKFKCVGAALSFNVHDLYMLEEETLYILRNPPKHFRNGLAEYERVVKKTFIIVRT